MTEAQTGLRPTALKPFQITASAAGFFGNKSVSADSRGVLTDVIQVRVSLAADRKSAAAGGRINYTAVLGNYSSVDLYGVKMVSPPCAKTALVQGSVIPVPRTGETLESGVSVAGPAGASAGCVPKGQSAALKYAVTVGENAAGNIIRSANAVLKFRDRKGSEYTGQTKPDTAVTAIRRSGLLVTESADKTFVTESGETVTFDVTVQNTGRVRIYAIVVTNPLPPGMYYKPGSTLKGQTGIYSSENPADGVHIGDLDPGKAYRLRFSVTVSL